MAKRTTHNKKQETSTMMTDGAVNVGEEYLQQYHQIFPNILPAAKDNYSCRVFSLYFVTGLYNRPTLFCLLPRGHFSFIITLFNF